MDEFFLPQTGDEKIDEAYKKVAAMVDKFESFSQFFDYFHSEVKTDNTDYVNRWLLMVIFAHLNHQHPFDRVYDAATEEKKVKLKGWLGEQLNRVEERK